MRKGKFKKIIVFAAIFGILLSFSGVVIVSTTNADHPTEEECGSQNLWIRNPETGEFECRHTGSPTKERIENAINETGEKVLRGAATAMLNLSHVILWAGGTALNASLTFSIIHFKKFVDATTAIEGGWRVIRDVINMSFIFILLYISISTILGRGQNMKKLVAGVVGVALLINFSLFMTSVIIDASNILALQFYKPLVPDIEKETEGDFLGSIANADAGLSNVFMSAVNAASVYRGDTDISASEVGAILGAGEKFEDDNLILISVMGSIFFLILAFIFFAAALLFVIRLVVLMLLMVFSPVAFLGFLLPKGKAASSMWWKNMTDQAVFAPVFMILMYLVAQVVTSGSFKEMSQGAASLSDAFLGQGDNITIILNFIIVSAFAIAAIVISKNFSGKAGNWAYATAGKASFGVSAWGGRKLIGGAGSWVRNREFLQTAAENRGLSGLAARAAIRTGEGAAKSSFDLRGTPLGGTLGAGKAYKGGYEKMAKDAEKREQKYQESGAKARAARAARKAAKETRGEEEAEYTDARTRGLRNAMDTIDDRGRIFLDNELYEGEEGKRRLQEKIKEVEKEAAKEYRPTRGSTEARLQGAVRALKEEERQEALELEEELDEATKKFEEAVKSGTDEERRKAERALNEIKDKIHSSGNIGEYVLARSEAAKKGKKFGEAIKKANQRYADMYANARFGVFSDQARRSVAQKLRADKSPAKKTWEIIEKAIKEGDIKVEGTGEEAPEPPKEPEKPSTEGPTT